MTTQTFYPVVESSDEAVSQDLKRIMQRAEVSSADVGVTPFPEDRVRYVPAGSGTAYWGPGSRMTFIVTGKETGGAFFLAEISVPPGGGPPPHIHQHEDESFQVLQGTLTLRVGGDTIAASAGDFAFLPRGIAHSFKNHGDVTAKALVLVTPAGLENYFFEVFDPAVDRTAAPPLPGKELIARALAVSSRYGLVLLPPA
jgi:quercetin dioxygenase-like cupin family protein